MLSAPASSRPSSAAWLASLATFVAWQNPMWLAQQLTELVGAFCFAGHLHEAAERDRTAVPAYRGNARRLAGDCTIGSEIGLRRRRPAKRSDGETSACQRSSTALAMAEPQYGASKPTKLPDDALLRKANHPAIACCCAPKPAATPPRGSFRGSVHSKIGQLSPRLRGIKTTARPE